MSLRWFHLFFIGTSIVLAVGVAVWALQNGQWLLALGALAGGSVLLVYRGVFRRKVPEAGLR